MPVIRSWISPFSPFANINSLATAWYRVHLPGWQHRVMIPTLYGPWFQGQLANRSLGNALCGSSPDDYAALRDRIEQIGIGCDGWSVPTADGDSNAQGRLHGATAAKFDFWMINFEHGWPGFWTPSGAARMNDWISGFWQGVEEGGGSDRLNGNVGVTMVTNSAMMQALDDDEMRAWVDGTNFDALEAYIPGDPGLDPDLALQIWNNRLRAIGTADRRVILILEQGDLPAMCQQYQNNHYGVQIWTLEIAAAQTWPDATEIPPEQQPLPEPYQPAQNPCSGLISSIGYMGGDLLAPVVKLKLTSQPKAVQRLVAGIRAQCDALGINHV